MTQNSNDPIIFGGQITDVREDNSRTIITVLGNDGNERELVTWPSKEKRNND